MNNNIIKNNEHDKNLLKYVFKLIFNEILINENIKEYSLFDKIKKFIKNNKIYNRRLIIYYDYSKFEYRENKNISHELIININDFYLWFHENRKFLFYETKVYFSKYINRDKFELIYKLCNYYKNKYNINNVVNLDDNIKKLFDIYNKYNEFEEADKINYDILNLFK